MPRIDPIPTKEWPREMGAALKALSPPNPRHPFPDSEGRPKGLNSLGTFAQHPELTAAFFGFNGHILFQTTLTLRQRELAVLRVAALRRCDYEWTQHVVLAGDVGISPEEVQRVLTEADSPEWSPADRAILSAVEELLADACVSDGTWAALEADLDRQQLMDLVFTVGAYDLIAMAFNSFGVELDEDLAKWAGPPLR